MPTNPVQAAAKGLPPFYAMHSACVRFLNDGDAGALEQLIRTRSASLKQLREKAAVLATFTPANLRTSDAGRALAASVADDLVNGTPPVLKETLPSIDDEAEREIAEAYSEWLFMERRLLCDQLYPDFDGAEAYVPSSTLAQDFHMPTGRSFRDVPMPSTRATAVLRAVGALPVPVDPMLELILQHRAAAATATANHFAEDEEIDAYAESVVNPIREAIEARPAITTEEGAREAIREGLSEFTICNAFEKSLFLAALAYLDGRAAA